MDTAQLIHTRQATLAALRAHIGLHWQDVQGELHLQYNEMPTWILLYANSDVAAAHQAFSDVVTPFMTTLAPVQFTVGYHILTTDLDLLVEALMDHDDIRHALQRADFGRNATSMARHGAGVFGSAVSEMRPQKA